MRIIHLIKSRNFAGSEQLMKTLASEQIAAGHQVYLCVKGNGYLWDYLQHENFNLVDLGLGKPFAASRIARFIKKNHIDIAHFHLTDTTKLLKKIFLKTGVGCVTHLHIHKNSPAYKDAATYGRVISISNHTHDFYLNEVKLPPHKIHKIYNGTNIHQHPFASKNKSLLKADLIQELALPPQSTLVLLAGRFAHDKGQDLLIEAAPLILKYQPNTHFLFSGLNKKKPKFFNQSMQRAQELGISDHIHYLGFREDICNLIRAADIKCIPSRIEPFGLVVIEAMMLETPVVTSGVGGISDIITQDNLAAVMNDLTHQALAQQLLFLLDNPQHTQKIVQKAKSHALEHFSAESMSNQVFSVYEQTLNDLPPTIESL